MNKYNKLKLSFLISTIIGSAIACNLPDLGGAKFVNQSVTVNTYIDSFDGKCTEEHCSLRDAIYQGNQSSKTLEIFLPGGLYRLDRDNFQAGDDSGIYGDLDILKKIIIIGDGMNITEIDGRGRDRVFHILPGGSLELRGLTAFNGNVKSVPQADSSCGSFGCGSIGDLPYYSHLVDEIGGGIIANNGYLLLDDVHITQGIADNGGGLINMGQAEIINSLFDDNAAEKAGGGIYNVGLITITGTNIRTNQSESGGGIYNYSGGISLTVGSLSKGDISGNSSQWGGGIYNESAGVIHAYRYSIIGNTATLNGGGIYNNLGEVTLEEPQGNFFNSAEISGGFIFNEGEFNIAGTATSYAYIGSNTAHLGGHIYNGSFGNILLTSLELTSGEADQGGAIFNQGNLVIQESVLIRNKGNDNGAAIFQSQGTAYTFLRNVTVTEHRGLRSAIHIEQGSLAILNSTIASNEIGGLNNGAGSINIRNSILDNNFGANCTGAIISNGNNIDDGNTCEFSSTGDFPNTSAQLDYDTFSWVFPPLSNSPAIDNGSDDFCPDRDQEKFPRPSGLGCDIGAFEFVLDIIEPLILEATPVQSEIDDPADQAAPATDDNADGEKQACEFTASVNLFCRTGPGSVYKEIDSLVPLDIASVLGISPDTFYVQIEGPNFGSACYVPVDEKFGNLGGDCDDLTVLPVPPTPVPATATTAPPITVSPIPSTSSPSDPTMNASISGTIFKDSNGNGNMNGADTGYSGITVQLGSGSCSSAGLTSAISNGSGKFSFTGLAAGTYCVSVSMPQTCGDYSAATTSTSFTINLATSSSSSIIIGFQMVIC